MPRKRNNQPATAYDLRRVKALVDVLAIEDDWERLRGLFVLAQNWETNCPAEWDTEEVIHALAKAAQAHAREQMSE
jgi:hypothetical protein